MKGGLQNSIVYTVIPFKNIYAEKKKIEGVYIKMLFSLSGDEIVNDFYFLFLLSIFSIFLQYDIFNCNEVIVSMCFFRGGM